MDGGGPIHVSSLLNIYFLLFVDVDECAEGYCDPAAICINTQGNYSCSCPLEGYTGDGYNACNGMARERERERVELVYNIS